MRRVHGAQPSGTGVLDGPHSRRLPQNRDRRLTGCKRRTVNFGKREGAVDYRPFLCAFHEIRHQNGQKTRVFAKKPAGGAGARGKNADRGSLFGPKTADF